MPLGNVGFDVGHLQSEAATDRSLYVHRIDTANKVLGGDGGFEEVKVGNVATVETAEPRVLESGGERGRIVVRRAARAGAAGDYRPAGGPGRP